ncbi:NAD(P)-dependent dehydrogenase, short-chain alcohol dehydrogenase family [Enhydrobacter aerosaccus]|uniref:NAD(P)-dependent dehydrogenase, short-chain alcohol dehydrogenase family n=1 Tax=Enhydrobacter aerosaccus TaxID=225324 RepID=A0A1T4T775_9HYPH|nr:SDR family oxidoreductase [Enhydrobacter aerosaccus]SKA36189.1 NAD(P)-dependent dehydrogenase, short-chain alcohol dehydrogenase family [Enhydrobacter aerosaccus]
MNTWAFVTGGGGDIGSAICHALAHDGFKIACMDLVGDRAEDVCAAIRKEGGQAVPFVADAADPASVAAATDAAMKLGKIKVLVNTAGKANGASILTTDYPTWRLDIAANLDSAFICIQALREQLIAEHGNIVNIATVNGLGVFGFPGYSAAKAGLIHLTKSLAVELGPFGVRVNAVAPGTVRTRAWDARLAANPNVFDELLALCPLPRISRPADVAHAVAFLASERASMITGQTLAVDGGLSAGTPAAGRAVAQLSHR